MKRKQLQSFGLSLITIFLAVVLLGASGDGARFTDLGHRMMCVCGCNQILLECNHVGCTYSDRMRKQLMAAIQAGGGDDSILQAFVKEYGTTVLAAPGTHGFDRVAWIMPFAVFLAGTLAAAMLIRSWKERRPAFAGISRAPSLNRYREQARKETEL
jgi:cytochrome c-type biogenesis protein CcmH/NrfF